MDARLTEALTLLHSGRPDLAFAQLSQITTTDPANAEAFSLLATACIRTQKLAEAEHAIQRAIELTPQNVDFYLTAANIEQDLGNLEASADLQGRHCACARALRRHITILVSCCLIWAALKTQATRFPRRFD